MADEANAAAKIKNEEPILVILGNPPYSGHSANRSEIERNIHQGEKYWIWTKVGPKQKVAPKEMVVREKTFIGRLIEDYKFVDGKPLGERNPKWLQDDYVKFIRFAQWRIEKTGEGIVGFITNHSYLDNPTFRGMRQSLIQIFNQIYVYDLHGSAKKKQKAPDGRDDKNVFDIQQGVAILLCLKEKANSKPALIYHADLWGTRESKYGDLFETAVDRTQWKELRPQSSFYLFVPQDAGLRTEYELGWTITEAMPINVLGFQTHRDHFAVDFEKANLFNRFSEFRSADLNDDEIRIKYEISDNRDWKIHEARSRLLADKNWQVLLIRCAYRPFDFRFCYFSEAAMDYPRRELVAHMLGKDNVALNITRQTKADTWQNAVVSDKPAPALFVELKDGSNVFPLYLYPETISELGLHKDRRPNLSQGFLKILAEKLRLSQEEPHGLPKGITPEDIFHYAYAVFHSPTYRARYAEFLKIDFPRLPLTSSLKLFRALAAKGADLVALHLMESPKLADFITEFPQKGDNIVEKVQYTDKDKRVWINKNQYFSGVPKAVWEFHIGGYQVCEKWLKDRKGRKLSYDDIQHYQKIVVALKETLRLMAEIDKLIPSWPITRSA